MPNYHLKVVKGRKEKLHPCESFTVTVVPTHGYYAENPHLVDVPKGQRIKFDVEYVDTRTGKLAREIILIPRDGSVTYVLDNLGNTIDTYPKKRDRQGRVEVKPEQEFGLKVGVE